MDAPRAKEPTNYASGYTLDLYCDREPNDFNPHGWDEFPHQFTGETFGQCASEARRRGWIIRPSDRTATCPKCSGKPPRPPRYLRHMLRR
jgi:hypothetical protein